MSLTIICMCLSFLTLSFGVYAATSHSLAVSNYINFSTTDIYIKVKTLKAYRNNTYTTTNAELLKSFPISKELLPDTTDNFSSEDELVFTSDKPYLVFEFSIQNLSEEYDSTLTITDISFPKTTNIEMLNQNGIQPTLSSPITFDIPKNTTTNIAFSAKVKSLTTSISKENGEIKFTLSFAKKV